MINVEIRIKGCLDESWSEWLGELALSHTEGEEMIMTGQVKDQSELYGLLSRLRDLALPLVTVSCGGNEILEE